MMEATSLVRRCEVCGYRFDSTVDLCPNDRRPLLSDGDGAGGNAADLGSYRLMERLGEGGMGAVYRAVHRKLGRTVAIKVLQKDLALDRGLINRFFHEARAANTIRHEHIVEVFDFVEDGDNVYFVMEFLRGRDLHDTIHCQPGVTDPIAPERAVFILEQIASALHATHARDIIHRDLKPENIFLCSKDGVLDFVKVIDFGIAKLDRPDGRSTVEGAVLGTAEYIAPEQARGTQIDQRADIYSLGCVAYEMLTRHQLFGGGTKTDVLTRQIKMEPPPLRTFVPTLPAALDAAVLRALAKDPADRPQTALEMAESLASALGRGLHDRGAFHIAGRPARVRKSTGLVLRASSAAARRARWKPVATTAAAAVLVVGAMIALQARRSGEPRRFASSLASAAGPAAAPVPARAPSGPAAVNVLLQSSPSGAQVVDDRGQTVGVTPHTLLVPAGSERQVKFQKVGFHPLERRFRAVSDTTIAVRLDPETPAPAHRRAGGRPQRSAGHGTAGLDSAAGTIDPFME